MPSPVYIGAASSESMQKGIASSETGLKLSNVSHSIDNPRLYSMDENGSRDGWAENYDISCTTTMDAEDAGTHGITFGSATTLNNSAPSEFGFTAGGMYLERATVTESRDAWKSYQLEFTSIEGIS